MVCFRVKAAVQWQTVQQAQEHKEASNSREAVGKAACEARIFSELVMFGKVERLTKTILMSFYVSVKTKWTWPVKFKTLTMKTRRQMFASNYWGQCVVFLFRLKVMVLFKNKESSLWDHFYWQKHLKLETSCSLPQQEAKLRQVYVYTYIHIHILVDMLSDTQSFSSHFNVCFVTILPFEPSATYYTAFQQSNVINWLSLG